MSLASGNGGDKRLTYTAAEWYDAQVAEAGGDEALARQRMEERAAVKAAVKARAQQERTPGDRAEWLLAQQQLIDYCERQEAARAELKAILAALVASEPAEHTGEAWTVWIEQTAVALLAWRERTDLDVAEEILFWFDPYDGDLTGPELNVLGIAMRTEAWYAGRLDGGASWEKWRAWEHERFGEMFIDPGAWQGTGDGDAGRLVMTCLADVPARPVEWEVPDFVPRGKLSMLAGEGGNCKTELTLHITACITRGWPCFGMDYPTKAGEVLLVSCEDDLADTVVPRLEALGANLARVSHIDGIRGKDGKCLPFCLTHYEALEQALARRPTVRLVVIDPAGAYVGRSGIDDHKDSELRALLAPLMELAGRRHVAILLVKHLNKDVKLKAAARVGGSAGYVNTVRAAVLVAPDPEDPTRRLLLPFKNNLTPRDEGIAFRAVPLCPEAALAIVGRMGHLSRKEQVQLSAQLFQLEWLGPAGITADDALAPQPRGQQGDNDDLPRAALWLRDKLGQADAPPAECVSQGNAALEHPRPWRWWLDSVLKGQLQGRAFKGNGFGSDGGWLWTLRPR